MKSGGGIGRCNASEQIPKLKLLFQRKIYYQYCPRKQRTPLALDLVPAEGAALLKATHQAAVALYWVDDQ